MYGYFVQLTCYFCLRCTARRDQGCEAPSTSKSSCTSLSDPLCSSLWRPRRAGGFCRSDRRYGNAFKASALFGHFSHCDSDVFTIRLQQKESTGIIQNLRSAFQESFRNHKTTRGVKRQMTITSGRVQFERSWKLYHNQDHFPWIMRLHAVHRAIADAHVNCSLPSTFQRWAMHLP
jgi:hypothetical protein